MSIVELRVAHIECTDDLGNGGPERQVTRAAEPILQYRISGSALWQDVPSVVIKHDDPDNPYTNPS